MMHARMNHPVMVVPDAMKALQALGELTKNSLPEKLLELVHLRASQINGCSACVDMHPKIAKRAGESDERLFSVAAWRDTPYFTEGERAALALTEALTRISDRADPVSDGRQALRRAGARGVDSGDRQHQCLEQAQCCRAPAGRRLEGVAATISPQTIINFNAPDRAKFTCAR